MWCRCFASVLYVVSFSYDCIYNVFFYIRQWNVRSSGSQVATTNAYIYWVSPSHGHMSSSVSRSVSSICRSCNGTSWTSSRSVRQSVNRPWGSHVWRDMWCWS